jgi:hypothetical protein
VKRLKFYTLRTNDSCSRNFEFQTQLVKLLNDCKEREFAKSKFEERQQNKSKTNPDFCLSLTRQIHQNLDNVIVSAA